MITQSPDTFPEAEELQLFLIRGSTVTERISRVRSLSQSVIRLSRRAIRRVNPGLNQRELDLKFVAYHYGEELAQRLRDYLETGSRE